jgi:hypothetical protein
MQKKLSLFFLILLTHGNQSFKAQVLLQTSKVDEQKRANKGYVLFAPLFSKTTYLIDYNGRVAKTWTSKYNPGQSVYLLSDGKLLRTGNDSSRYFSGGGGVIELFDQKGILKWHYQISDSMQRQHHDVCPLPNGHLLVLCWERISKEEALLKGRKQIGQVIWSEKIMELIPEGSHSAKIVWQWRLWDHLIQDVSANALTSTEVKAHPGKLDINFLATESPDWLHFNSVDYHAENDQILVSNRNLSEIYIIDHSTTTAEAATGQGGRWHRGGDFLFRWGNPLAYQNGSEKEQQLFRQHDATWIPKGLKGQGSILVFNNGVQRNGAEAEYSEVLSLLPVKDSSGNYLTSNGRYLPEYPDWIYQAKERSSFFSFNVSSAQRLPNGHTLICEGAEGRFFEVNEMGETVWVYTNPYGVKLVADRPEIQNQVFRCSWHGENEKAIRNLKIRKSQVK